MLVMLTVVLGLLLLGGLLCAIDNWRNGRQVGSER